MSEDTVNNQGRRSTRLSISIPVILSGVDAEGSEFRESARTVIVNKHGGKIATTRRLPRGTELSVENLALGVVAKANVVWLSDKPHAGDVRHVGLQLIEAQNVWGVEFPPDDWSIDVEEGTPAVTPELPPAEPAGTTNAETPISSLAGEEITIRLLQELQQSADDHAREFKERVKKVTQRVGLELELDLRERAANAKAREVGALEEEIKGLKETLGASRQEIGELRARIQEMKGAVQSAAENPPQAPLPLQEARRQLSALAKSVVESMNAAAAAGLSEYRSLLLKENQQSAERLRQVAGATPPSPQSRAPES